MKKKIIFTSGTYDLFHFGHLNFLLEAKKLGDILIVGVSTDSLIEAYKGMKPIVNYEDRFAIIENLKCVDKVVRQEKLVDINQFIELKADLFALGDDWKECFANAGINWLRENNKIAWIPYTKRLSTSSIKKSIIEKSSEIENILNEREKNGRN